MHHQLATRRAGRIHRRHVGRVLCARVCEPLLVRYPAAQVRDSGRRAAGLERRARLRDADGVQRVVGGDCRGAEHRVVQARGAGRVGALRYLRVCAGWDQSDVWGGLIFVHMLQWFAGEGVERSYAPGAPTKGSHSGPCAS
jgi:hypothetical protein